MIQFLSRNLSTTTWINRFKRTYISELYLIPFFTRLRGKEVLYVLHVNKAAGTSLFRGITENQTSFLKTRLLCMPHRFGLHNLPKKARVALFIRSPEARFASGFENTREKGCPHYSIEWSKEEAAIFEQFKNFDELVLGMSSCNQKLQDLAYSAWDEITHLKLSYAHYVGDLNFLSENLHRITFIGEQETFDSDWAAFCNCFFDGPKSKARKLNALQASRPTKPEWKNAIQKVYPDEYKLYQMLKERKLHLMGGNQN